MRGIGILVVGLLVLGATPASAGPEVVEPARCGDDAAMRLELKDMGDRIRVRVVCRSPVGHAWRIVIRHGRAGGCCSPPEAGAGRVVFEGTRLATGDVIRVQRSVPDLAGEDLFMAKARDRQTGQFCRVPAFRYVAL
jgi:hypothetical protein